MRLAWLGPLPPVRSGIAHYATLVVPGLRQEHEVDLYSGQSERDDAWPFRPVDALDPTGYDAVFVQMGNNPHHESEYRWALANPSVVVIHDLVLHHLIVELTLARGDAAGYVATLEREHGAAGRAWAEARVAGIHGEIGNFLFPAFRSVATSARHIIVHNRWAAGRIRASDVTTPITIAPHPWTPAVRPAPESVAEMRTRLALPAGSRIVSLLGFVTAAKRVEETMLAFAEVARRDSDAHLLIAGAPAPNLDVSSMAAATGIPVGRWTATGYLSDADFDLAVELSERVVNLRYPTAGETSGPLVRVIGAGRHVAVSDYAQFREIPDRVAVRIPTGAGEHEALVAFIGGQTGCDPALQRQWAETTLAPQLAVDAYVRAARGVGDDVRMPDDAPPAIPLFPRFAWDWRREDGRVVLDLRLGGGEPVRSLVWGEPAYRLIADVMLGDRLLASEWITPGADLRPGERVSVMIPTPAQWSEIRLRDALSGIPSVGVEPWGVIRNDEIR